MGGGGGGGGGFPKWTTDFGGFVLPSVDLNLSGLPWAWDTICGHKANGTTAPKEEEGQKEGEFKQLLCKEEKEPSLIRPTLGSFKDNVGGTTITTSKNSAHTGFAKSVDNILNKSELSHNRPHST